MKSRLKLFSRQTGFSLIELLVALAIGSVLIGGTVFVFSTTRAAFQTNEVYTVMQENARFALTIMEPDIELAGFWGKHHQDFGIEGSALERSRRDPPNPGPIIAVNNDCGDNWVLQFDQPLIGTNDIAPTWGCITSGGRYKDGTDVLAIRRVETAPVATADLAAGNVYMRSSEAPRSVVFEGTAEATGLPPEAENFRVAARSYYISSYSAGGDGAEDPRDSVPSLRRVHLTEVGGVATMVDQEITRGVEDMQIQYGIDLTPNVDGPKSVNAYVTADNPLLAQPNIRIRSVRIWLLMRSEQPEVGYVDDQVYQLGDVTFDSSVDGADQPETGLDYRRLLVSRTIFLRNQHQ